MAKESILKINKDIVFKETFGSEDLVRANGGTVTGVTFSEGNGSFLLSSASRISYNKIFSGTGSVRIKCKPTSFATLQVLFDFRDTTATPSGAFLYLNVTTGQIIYGATIGTIYNRGIPSTTSYLNSDNDIVITGISLSNLRFTIGSNYSTLFNFTGSFELFEIYKGTLTANEVKNLYENRQNREINNYSKQLVVNSDFLTDTTWSKEAGWTISSGAARCDGTNSARLTQNIGTIATQQYTVRYKVNVTSGSINIQLGGNGTATTISTNTETSEVKVAGATTPETLYAISTNFVGSIDYIYVEQIAKEILRVDARNGVIANKYSGSTTGTELLTNGTFDSGVITGWSNGVVAPSTYSVSDGILTLNRDGVNCFLNQAVEVIGKTYRAIVRYRVISGTPGFQIWHGSGAAGRSPDLTSTTWTEYVHTAVCTTATSFYLYLGGNGSVEVDWVKCEEVIPTVTPTAVSVVRSGDVYAMDFNGSTSKIDCGSYDTLVGNKTFIAWVKPRSFGEGLLGRIFSNGGPSVGVDATMQLYLYSSSKSFYFRSATASYAQSGVAYDFNKWTMVAVTRTSTGITNIFVNGVLSGTANQSSGTPVAPTTNLIIGNDATGTATFDGQLSNTRIIDGILSTQEITQLWQDEKSLYNL